MYMYYQLICNQTIKAVQGNTILRSGLPSFVAYAYYAGIFSVSLLSLAI